MNSSNNRGNRTQLDFLCYQMKFTVLGMAYIYLNCQTKEILGTHKQLVLLSWLYFYLHKCKARPFC